MALDALSIEILLTILEFLSPLDIAYAVRASAVLYRTFSAYRLHLLRHALRESIHPACRADVYTALDAQNISRLIRSGESIAKVKTECFSLFTSDRNRRRQTHDDLELDNTQLDTLFHLHATIERLIDSYCHWSLKNLSSHKEKPAPFHATASHPRSNLSPTEAGRLQRAFYRYEVYTRFQAVLNLLVKSDALNFSQIVLSFVSQFTMYEFEEFVCVQQFLAQFIRSLCEEVEDGLFSRLPPPLSAGADQGSVSQIIDGCGLSFFTKSYRDNHHPGHVKHLISHGLLYVLHLSLMKPQALKTAILESEKDSRAFTGIEFFSQGCDPETCDEKQRQILRGKFVDIPCDRLDSPNLGWKWGTSLQTLVKPDSAALFDLRNRGYVFWDHERLQESGLVNEPFVVYAGLNYFPSGHHGPFARPSIEERLEGFYVDMETLRNWKNQ